LAGGLVSRVVVVAMFCRYTLPVAAEFPLGTLPRGVVTLSGVRLPVNSIRQADLQIDVVHRGINWLRRRLYR
jgi:hypothetical protein